MKKRYQLAIVVLCLFVAIAAVYFVGRLPADSTISTQAVYNWGGGEQLVYGMPTKLTPTPMPILVDHEAGALVDISWEHYHIHKGYSFRVDVTDSDLDTDDELSICFTTPNSVTAKMHWFARGLATGAATFEVAEGPTVDIASGSNITVVNRNRGSTITSTVGTVELTPTINYITKNATITSTNTVIRQELSGAVGGAFRVASDSQDAEEFELAVSTVYCAILTGNADNLRTTLEVSWYEILE